MPGTTRVLLHVQQHAQAALLTDINSDHYGQVGLAKSTRAWAEKNLYRSTMSIATTAARKRYADGPGAILSSRRTVETPKPTTQASKLMQILRNVSTRIRRISAAPIGTPIRTLGRICGI